MNRLFPHMYDCPERNQIVSGITYGLIPFLVLPMALVLLVLDSADTKVYAALECLYQISSFVAVLVIFKSYFRDSWLNVSIEPMKFLLVCLAAASWICAVYCFYFLATVRNFLPGGSLIILGAMPMTGIELLLLPGDFFLLGKFLPALVLIFLGPVITAGLFYAPIFAPLSVAGHKIGAYLGVAVITALPRIFTYFTIWGGWKEPQLYLAQLPIHMIACWSYQKTDSVWAPIFTHAIANALICTALFAMRAAGILT